MHVAIRDEIAYLAVVAGGLVAAVVARVGKVEGLAVGLGGAARLPCWPLWRLHRVLPPGASGHGPRLQGMHNHAQPLTNCVESACSVPEGRHTCGVQCACGLQACWADGRTERAYCGACTMHICKH